MSTGNGSLTDVRLDSLICEHHVHKRADRRLENLVQNNIVLQTVEIWWSMPNQRSGSRRALEAGPGVVEA